MIYYVILVLNNLQYYYKIKLAMMEILNQIEPYFSFNIIFIVLLGFFVIVNVYHYYFDSKVYPSYTNFISIRNLPTK